MTDRRAIGASDHMSHHARWSAAGLLVIGLGLGTVRDAETYEIHLTALTPSG